MWVSRLSVFILHDDMSGGKDFLFRNPQIASNVILFRNFFRSKCRVCPFQRELSIAKDFLIFFSGVAHATFWVRRYSKESVRDKRP